MKKIIPVILSLCLIFLLSGCGSTIQEGMEYDSQTPMKEKDKIVVGVSQIGSESVWRTANTLSIQKTFSKENGYVLIFDNARQKQENQIKAIRNFISLQVDYIVFSPLTEHGWETVLQEAKEANIPVILMDRKIALKDTSLYTTWVGSDFFEEGIKAGKWLEGNLASEKEQEEEINIVVLRGTSGSSSVLGRSKGFESIAEKHSNWHIIEQADGDYTTAKGKEAMKSLLNKHDKIDVLVSQNDDMTFGAVEALKEMGISTGVGGDITIISFDAVKRALLMVQQGAINVDIECNPDQGPEISRVIQALENGETVEKSYFVDEIVFTPQNVEQYIEYRLY